MPRCRVQQVARAADRGLRGGQAYTQATLTGLDKSGDAVVRLADGETARVRPDTCYAANSADQTPASYSWRYWSKRSERRRSRRTVVMSCTQWHSQ